jgi:hypothetical protein
MSPILTGRCHCFGTDAGEGLEKQEVALPLRKMTYSITIINVLADVETTQIYTNPTEQFLSVQYRFPIPPKATLYKFSATFGARRMEGRVK